MLLATLIFWQWPQIDAFSGIISSRLGKPVTVEERLAQYGDAVQARLTSDFARAGVTYPAQRLTLIGFKEEKLLELWAGNDTGALRRIKAYPIRAASGTAGPKLREGDRQVPEGFYGIESLNPNSRYHLALRVNYPNAFDWARAKEENRANPGSDIMIHGKAVSIGCLAMGDTAAEELFVLVTLAGAKNIRVLLCPCDLRRKEFSPPVTAPTWTAGLYRDLKKTLADYPAP